MAQEATDIRPKEGEVATQSAAAFVRGFRDGLSAVVFPANAHRSALMLGSPKVDRQRILMMKIMLNAQRCDVRARQKMVVWKPKSAAPEKEVG